MWHKTVTTTFQKKPIDVIVFLDDSTEENKEVVSVRSMLNEYYLHEEITFSSRDAAYDFIKHYPVSMAKAFVIREAYDTGAVN